MDISEGCLAWR